MTAVLSRLGHSAVLAGHVLRELTVDTARLVVSLVHPGHRFRPYIVKVPLRCRSERSIAVLGTLVSLSSPRQVTVGVETDPPTLLVYTLDTEDADAARQDVSHLETLLLRAIGSPAHSEEPPEVSD